MSDYSYIYLLLTFLKRLWARILKKFTLLFHSNYKNTKIVYKSLNFIVIDKAYDLKINSNNKNEQTIQTFIKKKFPFLASIQLRHEYYFLHRLDYSTSGLMCIPLHIQACQVASEAIQERWCRKYYIALLRGYLSSNLLDLNYSIGSFQPEQKTHLNDCISGRDSNVQEIEKMCVLQDGKIKTARTLIVVLEKGLFDYYPTTKVLIRPITGRRHQIRVHCAHIGHTIVGDYTYSNKKDVQPVRMYLHALRLIIPNRIEDINVQTNDPFTEDQVHCWKSIIRCLSLNEAFEKINECC